MKRLVELVVVVGILAGMLAASSINHCEFYGSWGVEPTEEVRTAWESYKSLMERDDKYCTPIRLQFVRASSPKWIHDSRIGQTLRAVKVEYLERAADRDDSISRRKIVVVSYLGDGIRTWFGEGKGPPEYAEF